MNARAIATVLVCLAVIFAGCAGMNNGTGGDSAGDGATGDTASGASDDTTTAPSDATTTSSDDGTTTQSATAGGGTSTESATPAATTTPMATTQSTPTHATTSASEPTTGSETTTTDTTVGSSDGGSASVSNPYTEGDYFRITGEIATPAGTNEFGFEWRVLSVDGEQVTIKVTNSETGKSGTIQSDREQVFLKLSDLSLFSQSRYPIELLIPLLRGLPGNAPDHSLEIGSEWTTTSNFTGSTISTVYTVTGTDTVAGINCKKIKISGEVTDTACINKDVFFALSYTSPGPVKITLTVEEYRSGEEQ